MQLRPPTMRDAGGATADHASMHDAQGNMHWIAFAFTHDS